MRECFRAAEIKGLGAIFCNFVTPERNAYGSVIARSPEGDVAIQRNEGRPRFPWFATPLRGSR